MEGNICPHCEQSTTLVDSRSSSTVIICKKCSLIQKVPLGPRCTACDCEEFERLGSAGTYHWCPECRKVVSPIKISRQPITSTGGVSPLI